MDRNGKKPKAARDASNPQRSDQKNAARDVLGRMAADAQLQRARTGDATAPPNGPRKGHRP
ncbi:hypothetical protein J421_6147 (plasmid) [Gemmatirosa kalamazoonensis]|jgi:hypothetical protein|uniref:Uncharacterized protein n=1 Tax=Gemmatirosa kalamazoonensis TaxID=861299 RepID=W0RTA6_9BACT|nr:hypothetical protein [Gemmatirosa kalamazoonensis]AHG93682.1 hypothetical protein J421_6147 [Gemmatirosa kalamazoonensis]